MWEKWEQRYSDHLPLHFDDLNLYVNEHKSIHQATSAFKNKAKSYQLISNHKTRIITFFIWPRGASQNMFEVKGMLLPIFCVDINTHSDRKWKIMFNLFTEKLFSQNVLIFIYIFYRYHYIHYFICSGCTWRHVWTICNSINFT